MLFHTPGMVMKKISWPMMSLTAFFVKSCLMSLMVSSDLPEISFSIFNASSAVSSFHLDANSAEVLDSHATVSELTSITEASLENSLNK